MDLLTKYIPRLNPGLPVYFSVILLIIVPILTLVVWRLEERRTQRLEPRGCRKLGLRIRSHLADQYDPKYGKGGPPGEDENGCPRWKVLSLMTYPIKSCRGIELNKSEVVSTGMKYDRLFMFTYLESPFGLKDDTPKEEKAAHKWIFISQRTYPKLAKVKTELWVPDPSSPTYSPTAPEVLSGGVLVVTFPYEEDGFQGLVNKFKASIRRSVPEKSFTIPLDPTPYQIRTKGYEVDNVEVQKKPAKGLNMTVEVPPELKYFLHVTHPLALFRVDPTNQRQVFRCAPIKEALGYQPVTGFADSYPLHLLNLASVREFNTHVQEIPRLNILRFRPNIIITGPNAYAEDNWKRLRIGEDEYHVSCRTTRCKLPNVDPETAIAPKEKYRGDTGEPYGTLQKFRRIDQGARLKACMGMQMVPAKEHGNVKVGDAIELLESGEHFYL